MTLPSPSFWLRLLLVQTSLAFMVWAVDISCRNEAGEPVDWFVLYKLPKYKINESIGSGLDYIYLDSQTQDWQMGKYLINATQSTLGLTLEQIYKMHEAKDNSTGYVLYNDDSPNAHNYSSKLGHTKGCLLFDKSQGFWLIHSIPGFPPFVENGYGYPSTGKRNGQTAICVTYKYDQFPIIAAQLLVNNPNVYNCSIPPLFQQDLSDLQTICLGAHKPWIPERSLAKLQSAQGEKFLHFAKSRFYVDDIYAAWIAQTLKTDLLAESWQHARKELPSNCSLPYHVYNIKRIKIPELSSFYSYYDHSKWCVSWRYEDKWTCLGDLNREASQIWRGGGFLCTQNPHIYKSFRGLAYYYKNCTAANK